MAVLERKAASRHSLTGQKTRTLACAAVAGSPVQRNVTLADSAISPGLGTSDHIGASGIHARQSAIPADSSREKFQQTPVTFSSHVKAVKSQSCRN